MVKELDKVITVGDEDYNVNAVTADKVNKKLTINKIDLDGNIAADSVEFDGGFEKSISVVPVEGGRFAGPIRVEDNTEAQINDKAVLNYHDIVETVFGEFKNHSALYAWDKDLQVVSDRFKPIIPGNSPNSISIVRGLETHLQNFAEENWYKKYLAVYLYICTDTGNIYYGASPESGNYYTPTRIAVLSDSARVADSAKALQFTDGSANSPYTAESLAKIFADFTKAFIDIKGGDDIEGDTVLKAAVAGALEYINTNTNEVRNYTASDLLNLFEELSTAIKQIKGNNSINGDTVLNASTLKSTSGKTNYTADSLTSELSTIRQDIKSNSDNIAGINNENSGILKKAKDYTDTKDTSLRNALTGGSLKPKNASKADTAALADEATTADTATNDSDGKQINYNYYRCALNTSKVNKITISTSTASGGNKGDIWIKY